MSDPSEITGLPLPHSATHAVGMPEMPRVDLEAVLLEDAGQVLRRLRFLEPELREAEDRVDHLPRELGEAVDRGVRVLFQRGQPLLLFRQRCGLRRLVRRGLFLGAGMNDNDGEESEESDERPGHTGDSSQQMTSAFTTARRPDGTKDNNTVSYRASCRRVVVAAAVAVVKSGWIIGLLV